MLLSEQAYQKIDRELAKFPADQRQSAIMASLAIAQEEKGWLATDIIEDVLHRRSAHRGPGSRHFLQHVRRQARRQEQDLGLHELACALRDGERVGDYLKRKLGVDWKETTADGQFTLVEGDAWRLRRFPVLLVNNKHMCVRMTEESWTRWSRP